MSEPPRSERGCCPRLAPNCSFALLAWSLALALVLFSYRAIAEGDSNAAKGILVQHCIACHEVPGYGSEMTNTQLGAPSFATIADDPQTYDPQRLKVALRQPHWPMQQFILSERDVENLLAFIENLRSE